MEKLKVLFLSANPRGTVPLGLDEEIRQISAKIRAAEYRESIELISCLAARPDDLLQALLEHKPHIVHFSGHGSSAEELIFLDEHGQAKPVNKEALVAIFRTLKDNVRVVVLGAGETDRFLITVGADKSSVHEFSLVLRYNDDLQIESKPVKLEVFVSRLDSRYVEEDPRSLSDTRRRVQWKPMEAASRNNRGDS